MVLKWFLSCSRKYLFRALALVISWLLETKSQVIGGWLRLLSVVGVPVIRKTPPTCSWLMLIQGWPVGSRLMRSRMWCGRWMEGLQLLYWQGMAILRWDEAWYLIGPSFWCGWSANNWRSLFRWSVFCHQLRSNRSLTSSCTELLLLVRKQSGQWWCDCGCAGDGNNDQDHSLKRLVFLRSGRWGWYGNPFLWCVYCCLSCSCFDLLLSELLNSVHQLLKSNLLSTWSLSDDDASDCKVWAMWPPSRPPMIQILAWSNDFGDGVCNGGKYLLLLLTHDQSFWTRCCPASIHHRWSS